MCVKVRCGHILDVIPCAAGTKSAHVNRDSCPWPDGCAAMICTRPNHSRQQPATAHVALPLPQTCRLELLLNERSHCLGIEHDSKNALAKTGSSLHVVAAEGLAAHRLHASPRCTSNLACRKRRCTAYLSRLPPARKPPLICSAANHRVVQRTRRKPCLA